MWNLKCCAKFSRFLIPLVLISVFQKSLSAKKGYYTIIAPAVVRPESAFHISFSLNDFPKSCWFNISLTSYPEHKQIYGLEGIEVKPGSTKLVELHAPSFNNTYGFLEIFGYRGIISKESELVFFENEKFWAFVQTDKVKYKPGELIKFRIISIDQLKRPAKFNEDISVEIYDSESNTIKLIRDVKFIKGVFRGELQISEYPNLGRWRMKVSIGNRYLTHKDFEVVRYVLPKFNVVLNYPKEVWMKDNQTILEVNANYFYGEPVKGNLSVMVTSMLVPYPETIQTTTKQYRIDGKSTIILDFKEDLHVISQDVPKIPSMEMYTFHIEALVTEDLSEEQSRADIEIGIWTKPYKLEFQTDKNFKSDEIISIKAKLLIRDLNENLITNPEQPIEIIIECSEKSFQEIGYAKQKTIHVEYKNEIGKDFAIIKFKNKNYTECYMFAEYENCISLRSFSKIRPTLFEMDILTESPQEGKELETKLKNPEPFKEFSYEIVSRGDIVKSGFVQVPGNETTHILRFNVTSAMVPKITIYAHIIQNKNFVGQLKDILIKRAFPNSIELETENEVKPGESVYVNVTTDEGSYVGLMGVDPSALQSRERTGIFNEENVDWDLGSVNFIKSFYHTPFYYRTPEIITFSNALPPGYGGGQEPIGPTIPPKRIRKLFPESWLFLDFEKTPEEGLQILETAPDSITSWTITGFSINPESGLTFTKNTTNLRVFQEFFVLMDLPGLVKDGEIIEVPIYISNYLNQDALTTITIKSDSEDLVILEKSEDDSKSKQNISKLVEANKKDKILVFMKALKPGHYNVIVEAVSPVGSDAVQKTLNVQSQGIPYAMSKTFLVHLPKEGEQKGKITIDIPENAVRGSERVEVSVVGDIFRPLMAKLEKLARVPYGNSEDNMRLIVSNSIVLKYLKVLNYSIPSLEKKILENIELGYQNQMSFKYLDGSFGLFERKNERTGDIWHTVLSLWGLEQANEFISIDPKVINEGLEYLESKQQQNGRYISGEGMEEDVKCTAFGLMVFLMDKNSRTQYNEVIRKGLVFLYETADDLEYSPISVLAAYALFLGKYEKADEHLKKLNSKASLTSKQMSWTKSDDLLSQLETTAGSLINLFESQEITEQSLLQIVRGLIVSKTEESSITPMVALQAMIEFLEKLLLGDTKLDISFEDDQHKSGDFKINSENSQVFQTFEVSQNSRKINIQSKGHGFAVVDVRYNYKVFSENETSSLFTTNISSRKISKHFGTMKICLNSPEKNTQNKLYTMEVNIVSGFVFTEKDFKGNSELKSTQINNSRDKAVVYFELNSATATDETCFEKEIRKNYKVLNSKPGWLVVYGAKNKDQRSTKHFMIDDF